MVGALISLDFPPAQEHANAVFPNRRHATLSGLDARLSVWGVAARDAVKQRSLALVDGSTAYVERVGRAIGAFPVDSTGSASGSKLLGSDVASLCDLSMQILPGAVDAACRLLWVDLDRLRDHLQQSIEVACEAARHEIRRRQALYRRRARLWQDDVERLTELRGVIERLQVPRWSLTTADRVTHALFTAHLERMPSGDVVPNRTPSRLRVTQAQLLGWIGELGDRIQRNSWTPRPIT